MSDLVSIIMPAYKAEAYIGASVRSVLAQSYTNWELIIVDDCSPDNTVNIINQFSDSRIRLLVNEQNSGAAVSRNRALREAKGRWIAFLDADDLWLPEKLEKQLKYMTAHSYAFCCTDYRTCLNGEWLPYIITCPDIIDKTKMYNYCYCFTSTVIYDRNVIGLIQIANLKKNNDYAMWLQAVEKSPCYRMPECLSYYVKHENSISSGNKLRLVKYHYILYKDGLGRTALGSFCLTVRNLYFGFFKKILFRKPDPSTPSLEWIDHNGE